VHEAELHQGAVQQPAAVQGHDAQLQLGAHSLVSPEQAVAEAPKQPNAHVPVLRLVQAAIPAPRAASCMPQLPYTLARGAQSASPSGHSPRSHSLSTSQGHEHKTLSATALASPPRATRATRGWTAEEPLLSSPLTLLARSQAARPREHNSTPSMAPVQALPPTCAPQAAAGSACKGPAALSFSVPDQPFALGGAALLHSQHVGQRSEHGTMRLPPPLHAASPVQAGVLVHAGRSAQHSKLTAGASAGGPEVSQSRSAGRASTTHVPALSPTTGRHQRQLHRVQHVAQHSYKRRPRPLPMAQPVQRAVQAWPGRESHCRGAEAAGQMHAEAGQMHTVLYEDAWGTLRQPAPTLELLDSLAEHARARR
jgi:hypothetical protein